VVDLKKEIKLSDLVRRKPKAAKEGDAARPGETPKPPKAPRAKKSNIRELVGVKVGATQLAAAVVSNNGSPHLLKVARQALPPGIVGDGEVQDVAALTAGLQEFFTANDLPRRGVRLGIATNHVGVRLFEISGIEDEKQLANAVLFRAHDAVSIPVEQAIIDYREISKEVDESGTTNRRILLVAAYREPIERYAAAFRGAGIQLVGIDLEAFALLRAVSAPSEDGTRAAAAVVAVNVGHQRATLAVSDGAVCQFTRVLGWGGSKLAEAIERELGITQADASAMLPSLSLESPVMSADPNDNGIRAREAARRQLQGLARELVASLEFYQGQPDSLPISEILLSGGTARIPGFAAELERLTRVRVRLADPLTRVEIRDGVDIEGREDLSSLAVAIGLGVED
jgi:type IV pilus assembly protein PilM